VSELFFIQNGSRRRAKEAKCGFCESLFLTRINSSSKFCSRQCSGKSKISRVELKCYECGTLFERTLYSANNSSKHNFHFCSRKCKDAAQSLSGSCLEIRPTHYGNGLGIYSYRELAFDNFKHECSKCGYSRFKSVLQVHHKDKNRHNNTLENLEVLCPTCHMETHYLDNSGLYTKGA